VEFWVYGQSTAGNGQTFAALTRRIDGDKAVLTLPLALPARSMYLMWPKNTGGHGDPVAINRTEAWWIGSAERVERGQTISLYGRNLTLPGAEGAAWIYVTKGGQPGIWARVVAANPYRVQFTVPDSLDNGTYQVWAHNGHGGNYGWSDPLELTVGNTHAWTGETFDVRDFGARGDGVSDDSDAIRAAYSAAALAMERSGLPSTLYLPAGNYLLRYGIGLVHDIRILGEGMDQTFLRCGAAFSQPAQPGDGLKLGLIYGNGAGQHDIEIRGLSLDANGNFAPGVNSEGLLYCGWGPSSDFKLVDVRIQTLVPGTICAFLNNVERLTVTGCQFVGGKLFLFNGFDHAVAGCVFLGANDSDMSVSLRGTRNVSVTDCHVGDYDSTAENGQGLGRLVTGNGDYGTQDNVYIGGNVTVNLGPRPGAPEQNAGEQIMCEGNLTMFEEAPLSATPTSVTFASLAKNYVGQMAVISQGPGVGQVRKITAFDPATRTITVSPAWAVTPSAANTVLIEFAAVHWVAYGNALDGKDDYTVRYTAMSGIQPYGGCYEWIADGNTITNVFTGISCVALEQTSPIATLQPSFFHLYTHNRIEDCNQGVVTVCGIPERWQDTGVAFLGNVFRKNAIAGMTIVGVRASTSVPSTPGIPYDTNLFEHNRLENLARGFDGDFTANGSRSKNTVLYRNDFSRGAALRPGSFGVKFGPYAPQLIGNSWRNFETTLVGSPFAP
jgi:hypothetical protein